MPELIDESGQYPPYASALRISSELVQRWQPENPPEQSKIDWTFELTPLDPETVAGEDMEADDRLNSERLQGMIAEIRAGVTQAVERGELGCFARLPINGPAGRLIDAPLIEKIRDELGFRGYTAHVNTHHKYGDAQSSEVESMTAVVLTIDWSAAGPGLGAEQPEGFPDFDTGIDEVAATEQAFAAMRASGILGKPRE